MKTVRSAGERLAITVLLLLIAAGCGGPATPKAALTKQFAPIAKIFPFHTNLAAGSRLYFLVPKPVGNVTLAPWGMSPMAAVVHPYRETWHVWEYGTIPGLTLSNCKVAITRSPAVLTPAPVAKGQPRHTIMTGRVYGDRSMVGAITLSISGRPYPVKRLPDGFWFANVNDPNGQVVLALKNHQGRTIAPCT